MTEATTGEVTTGGFISEESTAVGLAMISSKELLDDLDFSSILSVLLICEIGLLFSLSLLLVLLLLFPGVTFSFDGLFGNKADLRASKIEISNKDIILATFKKYLLLGFDWA